MTHPGGIFVYVPGCTSAGGILVSKSLRVWIVVKGEEGRLQSAKSHIKEHCGLDAHRGSHMANVFESASMDNRNLWAKLKELSAQYDQELSNILYDCDGLQALLTTQDSHSKALHKFSHVSYNQ